MEYKYGIGSSDYEFLKQIAKESLRKTKVKIISCNSSKIAENGINDFLQDKQSEPDKAFRLIDIKHTTGIGYSEALIIYSEIEEEGET